MKRILFYMYFFINIIIKRIVFLLPFEFQSESENRACLGGQLETLVLVWQAN